MSPGDAPDPDLDEETAPALRVVTVHADEAGGRIDKVLATRLPDLSRARIQALIEDGRVSREGAGVSSGSAKAVARAGLADLEKIDGISKTVAKKIYDHFHADG